MAENGLRRGLVALVLLTAVVAAGAVLVAGGALVQDDDTDDAPENDTVAPENRTVDVERVNVTVELDPNDDLEEDLDYELAVVGNVSPLNDAANGTVDCTRDLCVLNGTIAPDAEGEELPRYELHGVVTGVAPSEGFTTHVNGTLEGDAIEGLGLGAHNVSASNETDDDSNETVVRMDGGDGDAETSAATIQTSDGTSESGEATDEDPGSDDASEEDATTDDASEEAATTDDASEEDTATDDASEEDATTDDASEEDATTDDASEEDATTDDASEEDTATDGGEPSESASDGESDDASSSEDNASDGEGDSASVSFDGCSVATVEGDAYAYEAGLRYYVDSGLDTSTYDNSEISTPATIDGNDVIGDARTTDVVIETVLVFDEDFQILTQVENPNYEDCVDTIEQQHEEAQE